jgi:AcrR family transcriptional regulator
MGSNKTGEVTKEKILQAAKDEFLEKGISGSTMESIAKRAGITRLMLYYHFESKDKIVREFFLKMISQAKVKIEEVFTSLISVKNMSPKLFLQTIEELMEPNKKLFILFITENMRDSLDQSEAKQAAFELIKDFYSTLMNLIEKLGRKIKDKQSFIIKMFYFQSMPLIMYMTFSDDLAQFFGFDKDKLKEVFGKKFIDTMIRTVMNK